MDPIHALAILVTLMALFAYINEKFFKMPITIGLMLLSLIISVSLLLLDHIGIPVKHFANHLLSRIDFSKILLEGMLGLLLFAGSLHMNINDLLDEKLEITILSTLGVLTSTVLIGLGVYFISHLLHLNLNMAEAMLFGAMISPTDPIATLAILGQTNAPKKLKTRIAGESLFNDGIGVVVFLVILDLVSATHGVTLSSITFLFVKEVVGGIAFGIGSGYLAFLILKSINNYQVEIMITLALVVGGYSLAHSLHVSAPIAVVVSGLLIGNKGRRLAMSDVTREHLDTFWILIDELLNALLFVLIGLEVFLLTFSYKFLLAGLLVIPFALISRLISIGTPMKILKLWRSYAPRAVAIMTWGGLRGGISVALALSLPALECQELLLTMTYVVVVFSIVFQGLTLKQLIPDTTDINKSSHP